MQALEQEIKEMIVRSLALEDVSPTDIDATAPLFGEGLCLDSIDALELGVALQKQYGVRFAGEPEEARHHFASVRALATFVEASRQAQGVQQHACS